VVILVNNKVFDQSICLIDINRVGDCWSCKKLKLYNFRYNLSFIKVNASKKNTEDLYLIIVVWLIKWLLFEWNNIINISIDLFFIR